ncbi:Uncharacterised protein [Pseudomonas putida]|nr:Uncharacterised protein [Pseudomonas putida]CAB5588713.1 Uncharacterised protein [Pseudomonas putida]CAB5629074.1 Uncharacterised protein [Pseudomonas putida]CAB5629549.1 Uncharacterised protein [Pseudomonas putida]CAB5706381.1 Uncharacterised protein [Pseudomonas putida]
MTTVANELLEKLTHRVAEEAEANEALIDSEIQLKKAAERYRDARAATTKALEEIETRARQNAVMAGAGFKSESVHCSDPVIAGLSVRVETPKPDDNDVQVLVESIVRDICNAIVERLQPRAEGATTS